MHRILMYADVDEKGLAKLEQDLLEGEESVTLTLDWVSWQLDYIATNHNNYENAWKIMYYLINNPKIKLI